MEPLTGISPHHVEAKVRELLAGDLREMSREGRYILSQQVESDRRVTILGADAADLGRDLTQVHNLPQGGKAALW